MAHYRRIPVWLALLAAGAGLHVTSARLDEELARLLKVHGSVKLKQGRGSPWKLLHEVDQGRVLRIGWTIHCDPGGTALIELGREQIPLPNRNGRVVEYTVERFRAEPVASLRLQKLRDRYVKMGGGRPAVTAPFYSPADDSVVSPRHLVLRWVPRTSAEPLYFDLREEGKPLWHKPLWHRDAVDGRQGKLDCTAVRQALERFRQHGGQGPLSLTMSDLSGDHRSTVFLLLSRQDEAALDRQLEQYDRESTDALARHVGRALAFTQSRMYVEAAQELWDAAMTTTPENPDLLVVAILAHRVTGNVLREAALRRRLPAGTPVPE